MADTPRPDLADTAIDTSGRRTPDPAKPELADTVANLHGTTEPFDRAPDLERGATIGRYLVLEVLGAGGMGVVYAAYDPELDRKVALKLVRHRDDRGLDTSDGRARMLREAQAIARLSHPNVVAVHDVGTSADGELFIAMELVDGVTLGQWLLERQRTVAEILDVFVQAGRGLAAAHRAGLIHRDFKPDNVLLGKDNRARVVDFGLVRAADGSEDVDLRDTIKEPRATPSSPVLSAVLTHAGDVIGTPMYMSPEQIKTQRSDARSDEYSFCVALHEALSGHKPFEGEDFETVKAKILTGALTEMPAGRKVPAHIRAAVRRGAAVEPASRFGSMDELLGVLSVDPRARTKRIALGAGVAAVIGAALIVPRFVGGHHAESPCGDARGRLAGAWDPTLRDQLHRAFATTKAGYAEAAFEAVAHSLERYADAWTFSYEDSCKATHVRHEQSVEMLDIRSACLHHRRTELATLVDLLAHADDAGVRRAHTAVARLSPVEDCNDLEALRAPVKVPSDPAMRAEIEKARDELARAQALLLAGRLKDALPIAKQQYEAAKVFGYRPVEAEAASMVAALELNMGNAADAEPYNLAALSAAIASNHDEAAFRIATQMVTAATDRQDFARAHDWAAIAEGFAHGLGDSPAKVAALHSSLARLLSGEGKFEAAAKEHEAALAIRERIDPQSEPVAASLNSLSYVYDEIGRYDEARKAGERGLALNEALLGPMHPDIATALNNLGNVVADQGDLDAATRYYERALAIHEGAAAAGQAPLWVANVINNLGEMAYERGRYDEALVQHRKALAIRMTIPDGDPDVAMSHANIGNALREQGDIKTALDEYKQSLAIAERSLGKDHPFVGDALLGIGECTYAMHQLDVAQPALERSLAIRKQGSRPAELAEVQLALAKTLWDRGQHPRARELGHAAHDALVSSPGDKKRLDEIDAWLAKH